MIKQKRPGSGWHREPEGHSRAARGLTAKEKVEEKVEEKPKEAPIVEASKVIENGFFEFKIDSNGLTPALSIITGHVLEKVVKILNELPIRVCKNGAESVVMDSANVALVMLTWNDYKSEGVGTWGLSLSELQKVIDASGEGEKKVRLEASKKDNQYEALISCGRNSASIKLLELEVSTKSPPLEYTEVERVVVDRNEVLKQIRAFAKISDSIWFAVAPGALKLSVKGEGGQNATTFINGETAKKKEDNIKSLFPVEYLLKLFDAMPPKSTVEVSIKSDYPLHLKLVEVAGSKRLPVGLRLVVAPRIEND